MYCGERKLISTRAATRLASTAQLNRPDNRGGYLVKVKYPSMSYYPGFVGSFLQPELEEYTR